MNKDYIRYIMKKKGLNSLILSKELGIKQRWFNKLLNSGGFNVHQVIKILDMFEMSFEDVFIKKH